MFKKLIAVCAAGMLSFATPAAGQSGVITMTTPVVPPAAELMQQAVITNEITQPQPAPVQQAAFVDPSEQECVATAMYYEAKGEPLDGKKAVGYVVMNRVKAGKWKNTACGVVKQPWQFSWYKPGLIGKIPTNVKTTYLELAQSVMTDYSRAFDTSRGATHFHATYVSPKWAKRLPRLIRIGGHIFYR